MIPLRGAHVSKAGKPLGQQEARLAELLLTDADSKSIAHQMGIPHGTKKVYAGRLFRKLGVRNGRVSVMAAEIARLRGGPMTALSALAANLREQLQCKADMALRPEDPGLLRWRDDLVVEEVLIRAEEKD